MTIWVLRFGPKGRAPNMCLGRHNLQQAVEAMERVQQVTRRQNAGHLNDRYVLTSQNPLGPLHTSPTSGHYNEWNREAWHDGQTYDYKSGQWVGDPAGDAARRDD